MNAKVIVAGESAKVGEDRVASDSSVRDYHFSHLLWLWLSGRDGAIGQVDEPQVSFVGSTGDLKRFAAK